MTKEDLKEFNKLKRKNSEIVSNINNIFEDFGMEESKDDLWELIDSLIENEIEQESYCNQ